MRQPQPDGNKASAIIRFFIGLCLITIFIFVTYYLVAVRDWSYLTDNTSTSAGTASRDEPSPFDTPSAIASGAPEDSAGNEEEQADATQTPTLRPTATPAPTPTPVITPDPTTIPEADFSASRSMKELPEAAENGKLGISRSYVSKSNNYQVMVLEGWGYLESADFDGVNCASYLVTTSESTGEHILYQATNIAGLSGRKHDSVATNPNAADWRVVVDCSEYADGVYYLTLGLGYKAPESESTEYFTLPFSENYSFTVLSGEIIDPVPVTAD